MKKFLNNKIRSERGVTIFMGLLVLLICTVVASIILTASTTATGRMSQLENMDERYYAVMGEANYLRDNLVNCSPPDVELYKLVTTVYESTTYYNDNGVAYTTPEVKKSEEEGYQFVFPRINDTTQHPRFIFDEAILFYTFGMSPPNNIRESYDEDAFSGEGEDYYENVPGYDGNTEYTRKYTCTISHTLSESQLTSLGVPEETGSFKIIDRFPKNLKAEANLSMTAEGKLKLNLVNVVDSEKVKGNAENYRYKLSLDIKGGTSVKPETQQTLSDETEYQTHYSQGQISSITAVRTEVIQYEKRVSASWKAGDLKKGWDE